MPCRRRRTGSAPGRGWESAVRAVGVGQRTILRMRAKKAGANRPATIRRPPCECKSAATRPATVGKRRYTANAQKRPEQIARPQSVARHARSRTPQPARKSIPAAWASSGRGAISSAARFLTPCLSRPPAPSLSNCPPARPSAHCPRGRLRPPRPSFRARSCVSGAPARRRR